MVKLGHAEGMLVMGYFTIGANTRWGQENPDLSYGTPSTYHIPYTDEYLAYLKEAIGDAVKTTGIDGFMADWIWQPKRKSTEGKWIESEKKLYAQLMGEPFPGEEKLSKEQDLAYSRKAIDRCWKTIRQAVKQNNPDCIIWLTCNNLKHPHVVNSDMYKEVDWLMAEAGDINHIEEIRSMVGEHTRLINCLADWNRQDPTKVVPKTLEAGVGLYGFAKPATASGIIPLEKIFSRQITELSGDDRNIAVLARAYHGKSIYSIYEDGKFVEPESPPPFHVLGTVGTGRVMASDGPQFIVEDSWIVGKVPAGFPVDFCLLTSGRKQYVAYYDEERRMTVASRALDSDAWIYQVLPSRVAWDSHNYITMAVDNEGHLHVSGNMHVVPLIYFRTEKAGDVTTLQKRPMTGKNESRATYPKFLQDNDGRLIFHYRDGGSGRGNEIYNVYDTGTREWRRLLNTPLVDGQGKMNAYMAGPSKGPDGWFHMHGVWRDTPDCATNHHLSYARSKDLIHWESAFGDKVELPITLDQNSLWVDPIPSGGGIINGGHKLFFDREKRPIVTYHKSDENGKMQIYAARPENGKWVRHLLTEWEKPVEFSGRGSMGFIGIRIGTLERIRPGLLTMEYRHRDYGAGRLFLDEDTLRPLEKSIELRPEYPPEFYKKQSEFPGMGIRRSVDIGDPGDPSVRYLLQWETLGRNFDRPRKPPLPAPGHLLLYELKANE